MSDYEEEELSPRDVMLKKHKAEQKALKNELQGLKKSIPKGDKKKKKEVDERMKKMQEELDAKHAQELCDLEKNDGKEDSGEAKERVPESGMEGLSGGLYNVKLEDSDVGKGDGEGKKMSRAEKRRVKKEAEAKERREQIRKETEGLVSHREVELENLKKQLQPLKLRIKQIKPDGHCLYSAIADQLSMIGKMPRGVDEDIFSLRSLTAEYVRSHSNDFIPFLINDQGDMLTEEEFSKYCRDIEETNCWGGQVEIQALASALGVRVLVHQSGREPIVTTGGDGSTHTGARGEAEGTLNVSYHMHEFGLGAHYNSLVPVMEEQA
eukprot:Nk52_evm6s128 gene=Nk52_evmTU6s128